MAQQIIGTIPTFSQGYDDWKTYEEILDQFFVVNNVEDEKKSAFLISCIGSDTYKTLRDLCHPVLPKDKPFASFLPKLQFFAREQISTAQSKATPKTLRAGMAESSDCQWIASLPTTSSPSCSINSSQACESDKYWIDCVKRTKH